MSNPNSWDRAERRRRIGTEYTPAATPAEAAARIRKALGDAPPVPASWDYQDPTGSWSVEGGDAGNDPSPFDASDLETVLAAAEGTATLAVLARLHAETGDALAKVTSVLGDMGPDGVVALATFGTHYGAVCHVWDSLAAVGAVAPRPPDES